MKRDLVDDVLALETFVNSMNLVVFCKLNLDSKLLSDLSPKINKEDVGNGEDFIFERKPIIW